MLTSSNFDVVTNMLVGAGTRQSCWIDGKLRVWHCWSDGQACPMPEQGGAEMAQQFGGFTRAMRSARWGTGPAV